MSRGRIKWRLTEALIFALRGLIFFLSPKYPHNAQGFPIVNGVPASRAQLRLAEALGVKRNHVNYKVCGYYIDIAFPRRKIAVEYDGRFWHEGREQQDQERVDKLVRCGWRVLSIKADSGVPPVPLVKRHMKMLSKKRPYVQMEWSE